MKQCFNCNMMGCAKKEDGFFHFVTSIGNDKKCGCGCHRGK